MIDLTLMGLQDVHGKLQVLQNSVTNSLVMQKECSERLIAVDDWLREIRVVLETGPEMKLELFEKKAQLAKYANSGKALYNQCGFIQICHSLMYAIA